MGVNTTAGSYLWLIKFLGWNPLHKNMATTDVFCFSVPKFTCSGNWHVAKPGECVCEAAYIFLMLCPDRKWWGRKEKGRLREKAVQAGNYDWPIKRAGCQCQRAQLWTVGNSSCGGTLLKRSSTVRSGHSPKVYMAEVTGRMVNTSKRE